jgi:DNA-binding HxlR family transcriptional regulator
MKSYGQFCPVAKAAEVVAERWTPLVLRELLYGSVRFNDLRRGVPLMSPSLLSRRLKELEQSGIVTRASADDGRSVEYHLTPAGRELAPIIDALGLWGRRWLQSHIEKHDLDAGLLMWDIRRKFDPARLPSARTVIKFEFSGTTSGKRLWWLVAEAGEVELCLLDPGFELDLLVRTHLRTMTEIWMGDRSCRDAIKAHDLTLEGDRALVRDFPDLFTIEAHVALTRLARKVG